jgi:hypothetical protein
LIDEVDLDVVPLDICGIVLGSPYIYDRKSVFFFHENKYHLTKGGVEYIVRSHNMRVNTTLVSAGKMKRLINTNKKYVLLVVRQKYVRTFDAFQGCDPSHKKELIDIVSKYDDIFQEPDGLPPKREIQHEIVRKTGPRSNKIKQMQKQNTEDTQYKRDTDLRGSPSVGYVHQRNCQVLPLLLSSK